MRERIAMTVEIPAETEPARLAFRGRTAWALGALSDAGERGVTPIERPAPRWSAYICLLRRAGLVIETIEEPHGGLFKGTHGRYVLRTPVRVVAETFRDD
jgi:hypothetical protein